MLNTYSLSKTITSIDVHWKEYISQTLFAIFGRGEVEYVVWSRKRWMISCRPGWDWRVGGARMVWSHSSNSDFLFSKNQAAKLFNILLLGKETDDKSMNCNCKEKKFILKMPYLLTKCMGFENIPHVKILFGWLYKNDSQQEV